MKMNGVEISFLGHSGFLIANGKKIAIDPYHVSEKVTDKMDFILVTHSHYDHCSIKDIQKLSRKGTIIVVPADAQSKIAHVEDVEMQIIEVGDELEFEGVKINAVPAYNIDKSFHPKSEGWMGYVIKMENAIIYHAGDTDKIPDIQKLTGYAKQGNDFAVILPVSGTFVMTAEEAADVASLLNPTVAIPMHYGAGVAGTVEDAQRFVKLCQEANVRAEILEKI